MIMIMIVITVKVTSNENNNNLHYLHNYYQPHFLKVISLVKNNPAELPNEEESVLSMVLI